MNALCSILTGALALSLAGCSSDSGSDFADAGFNCDLETRDDTYSMGMSKPGTAGYQVVLMDSTPAPPAKGNNDWQLQIVDDTGAPADGMDVTVTPFMPDHNHGTPIESEVTPTGSNGEYSVTPVNLWMPGLWRVTVDIGDGSGDVDAVEFFFCING